MPKFASDVPLRINPDAFGMRESEPRHDVLADFVEHLDADAVALVSRMAQATPARSRCEDFIEGVWLKVIPSLGA